MELDIELRWTLRGHLWAITTWAGPVAWARTYQDAIKIRRALMSPRKPMTLAMRAAA